MVCGMVPLYLFSNTADITFVCVYFHSVKTGFCNANAAHQKGNTQITPRLETLLKTNAFRGMKKLQPRRSTLCLPTGMAKLAGPAEHPTRGRRNPHPAQKVPADGPFA